MTATPESASALPPREGSGAVLVAARPSLIRAMNEQLRAQAHRLAAAVSSPEKDEELREAHARLVSLQREVVNLRHLARQMNLVPIPQAGRLEQDSRPRE